MFKNKTALTFWASVTSMTEHIQKQDSLDEELQSRVRWTHITDITVPISIVTTDKTLFV